MKQFFSFLFLAYIWANIVASIVSDVRLRR